MCKTMMLVPSRSSKAHRICADRGLGERTMDGSDFGHLH